MEFASLGLHAASCAHDHLVQFYETESCLVDTVCSVLTPALRAGDATIVVATAIHRKLFEAALRGSGIDVDAAIDDGRYLPFEAEAVLRHFMVDGRPDPALFQRTIRAVFAIASEGGRQIRVYGEMVALLWDDGDVASALALEDLWNDLAELHAFDLLCAYPVRAFEDEGSGAAFKRICEQHTMVVPR
ncbi:MAG TPA: MEDS domain-containing protein [Acidimicrobiales bacterium]|nr:MEDS domain-containing protein [Acidimicrobiales bacterium]